MAGQPPVLPITGARQRLLNTIAAFDDPTCEVLETIQVPFCAANTASKQCDNNFFWEATSMGPYTKTGNEDDNWEITNGDGDVIARVETEKMVDCLMACLTGILVLPAHLNYEADEPYGEGEEEE